MVGDGQAGEAQRSAQNEGDDQHECESDGCGPGLRAAGGIGWRRFRPGSRMLTTFGHTQIRHLPIGGSSRERAAPGRPGASPCSAPPVCGRTTSGACAGPLTGTRTARAGGPFSQWDLSVELGGADGCLRAVVRAELCPVVLVPDE